MVDIKRWEILGAAAAALASSVVYLWTVHQYRRIASSNSNPAVDKYIDNEKPPFVEKLQCVLLYLTTKWTRNIHKKPYELVTEPHKYIPGLLRTRAARAGEVPSKTSKSKSPLVIGTIRK